MTNHDLQPQSEKQRRFGNVLSFLKRAETKYPNLASQLPNLLSKMLGDKAFNPQLMEQNAGNVAVGGAILGEWLKDNGFGGFSVSLSMGEGLKKAAAKALVTLPTRDGFFQQSGVGSQHWVEMQNAMVELSQTMGQAIEIGFTPKQVVAALVIESTAKVGDERPNTSLPTREMLNKASGGKLAEVNRILNQWVQGK